jgi:hypothetical protein
LEPQHLLVEAFSAVALQVVVALVAAAAAASDPLEPPGEDLEALVVGFSETRLEEGLVVQQQPLVVDLAPAVASVVVVVRASVAGREPLSSRQFLPPTAPLARHSVHSPRKMGPLA